MKKCISFLVISMCMFLLNGKVYGAVPVQVVKKELEYIVKHESDVGIFSLKNKGLAIRENRVYDVRASALVKVKQVSILKAEKYIPNLPQYIYKFGQGNVQVYYIVVRSDEKKDEINYFLQVFAQQQGDWRIVESVALPIEEMEKNSRDFEMKK